MLKEEAHQRIIEEWRKLPSATRRTEQDAYLFCIRVRTEMPHLCDFRTRGDKHQVIMGWLRSDMEMTRGQV